MVYPSIEGQLGWDAERKEVQYILSWEHNNIPSDQVTTVYGTVEVISEGRASNVVVLTERIPADTSVTVRHPNGKALVDVPAKATEGQELYFSLSSGYSIDPPEGKMFVAGGVAYNTTALPMTENEENRIELTELSAEMTIQFNYSTDMPKHTLEICYLDPNAEIPQWSPAPGAQIGNPEDGIAKVNATRLGAYALMMRKEATLGDVEQTLEEVNEAFKSLKLAVGSNSSSAAVATA